MRVSIRTYEKRFIIANEERLYSLAAQKDGGKYEWTLNLGDNGLGEISLDESFAIKEFKIGEITHGLTTIGSAVYRTESEVLGGSEYQYFQEEIADAYDYTTYKSGGDIWGAAAKKCLGVKPFAGNCLIFTEKGTALVNISQGKIVWKKNWSYSPKDVQYLPTILNDNLVYCIGLQLASVSMKDGSTRFHSEESKRCHFVISPDKKYILSVDEEGKQIKVYEL